MKLKEGIIISEANGEFVAVDAGIKGKRFNGMLKLNKTAAFIAGLLKEEKTNEELIKALTEKYDVTEEIAGQSIQKVIDTLSSVGFLD